MLILPNGCTASELNVIPANWESKSASTKKSWVIYYRYYDPAARNQYPAGKLIRIKGFNRIKNVADRQAIVRSLIANEEHLLKVKGYNPIIEQLVLEEEPEDSSYLIPPSTLFIVALEKAKESLTLAKSTKSDIASVIKSLNEATGALKYSNLPLNGIETRHIKNMLDHLHKNNQKFSTNRYNKARAYLLMLFKELKELQAIKYNPVLDISKKKITTKLRTVLSDSERMEIDVFLKHNFYAFWRFLHIFFHSGTRIIELLNLQVKDVDLQRQQFKVLIRKGKMNREVRKTIKDIVLPLWQETMSTCKPADYIFSVGLMPGKNKIRTEQVTRRWRVHVKGKLGVEADFYSLKHLNTTEMLDYVSDADVAKLNAHTSTAMVQMVYDVRREERQHERLKKVGNGFV